MHDSSPTMADGPQLANRNNYPEYTRYDQSKPAELYDQAQPGLIPATETNRPVPYIDGTKTTQATILGIRRRNFWILVALAVILVGATIGGSVGGSLAVRGTSYGLTFETSDLSPAC